MLSRSNPESSERTQKLPNQRWQIAPPQAEQATQLAQATGLSERTVEGWGKDFAKRPEYVLNILRKEDIINQIRQLVLPPDAIKE